MIIKVCGLMDNQNIQDIIGLNIDWIGYNFYQPSSRYISAIPLINKIFHQKIVGVFVNASESTILQKAIEYKLDYVQLHGDESPEFCKKIKESFSVIKVFRIDDHFNSDQIKEYEFCDFFLFDTASTQYGGSGQKFDWSFLNKLDIKVPFLLSGGIGPDDLDDILKFRHPNFKGIDINSKFEVNPGIKDVEKVKNFVDGVKELSAFEDIISTLGFAGEKGIEETSRDPHSLKERPTLKDSGEAKLSPLGAGVRKGNKDENSSNNPHSLKGRPARKDSGEAGLSPLGAGGRKGNKDENSSNNPHSLKGRPARKDNDEALISPSGDGGEKGIEETSRDPQSLKGRPTLKDSGEAKLSPLGAGGRKGNKDENSSNNPHSLMERPTLKDSGEAGLSPLGARGKNGNKDENSSHNPHSLKGRPTLKDSDKALSSPLGVGGERSKSNEEKSNENEFFYDMFYGATPNIFETAAALRRKMTSEELKVWDFLKSKPLNLKFRRQHPIDLFVADFYCHSIKLVIEIDGINHQYNLEADLNRDKIFESFGITILRITNNEVNTNFQNVINKILEEIVNLKNQPSTIQKLK